MTPGGAPHKRQGLECYCGIGARLQTREMMAAAAAEDQSATGIPVQSGDAGDATGGSSAGKATEFARMLRVEGEICDAGNIVAALPGPCHHRLLNARYKCKANAQLVGCVLMRTGRPDERWHTRSDATNMLVHEPGAGPATPPDWVCPGVELEKGVDVRDKLRKVVQRQIKEKLCDASYHPHPSREFREFSLIGDVQSGQDEGESLLASA